MEDALLAGDPEELYEPVETLGAGYFILFLLFHFTNLC